jgi:gamma-glutamyl hercynylcysteine S-oxide synthase
MVRPDDPEALSPRSANALAAALRDSRNYTLALYAHLTDAQQRFPQISGVNLPRWEIGHIGWFQEYWCRRYRGKNEIPAPSLLAGADALWDSSKVPYATRWTLPLPAWDAIHAYLDATLAETQEMLAGSKDGDRYFFELALYHEDMHGEALLMTLQTLALPAPVLLRDSQSPPARAHPSAEISHDVTLPGGAIELGTARTLASRRFVFDNEKWAHRLFVAPFAIARRCVTNAEFLEFVEDDGYARPELWSEAGRAWLAPAGRTAPAYWRADTLRSSAWQTRYFDVLEPLALQAPVQHINWFEADAWCRWAGRRLPTEAEWECAARQGLPSDADDRPWQPAAGNANLDAAFGAPVAATEFSQSAPTGIAQMLGNVWEWTSSKFVPYPDFSADPYADYSAPWFGTHYVMRGGSWATRSRLVHHRFRNFYQPERHDPFVGFRTCALPT